MSVKPKQPQPPDNPTPPRLLDLIIPLLGTMGVMLPVAPAFAPGVNDNSGIYLYAGWCILQGDIPYLQLWDHKPPLVFYINALGAALSPGSHWGIWMLECAALLLAAYLGYKLMKAQFGSLSALLSTFLWLQALFFIFLGGNQTTDWSLPLQFGALLLFARAESHEKPERSYLLIGLLSGLAFLIKQTAVGIWLAIGVLLLAQIIRRKPAATRKLGLMAAGASAVLLLVSAYFLSQGALAQLWDAAFAYNFHFSASAAPSAADRLRNAFDLSYIARLPIFPIAVLGVLAAAFFPRRKQEPLKRGLFALLLLDGAFELGLILMTGDVSKYYFETILPALALFSASAFWVFDHWLSNSGGRKTSRWAVGALAIGLLALGSGLETVDRAALYQDALTARQAAIRYVRENTKPEDKVLAWRDTRVNYFAQRESPTRYLVMRPLMDADARGQARALEFLDELLAEKPALMIDTKMEGWGFLDFPGENAQLEEKVRLLMSYYEQEEMIDDWVVYRLIQK
jgi:hypothetical protein